MHRGFSCHRHARLRPVRAVLVALALVAAAGGSSSLGCKAESYPRLPDSFARPLSAGSAQAYLQAMQLWGVGIVRAERGETRRATLNQILALLESASNRDETNPLLISKRADILIELRPDDEATLEQAARLYEKSFGNDAVRAWVPGMIGLSETLYRKAIKDPGNWDVYEQQARACVEPAWAHLTALEREKGEEPPKPAGLFDGLFGGGNRAAKEDVRPGDPTVPKNERYAILMDFLYAEDAWRIDNHDVLAGHSVADGALNAETGSPLVRRLRARLQFQKDRWTLGPGRIAADPRKAFDNTRDWSRDCFEVEFEIARQYRVLADARGQFDDYKAAIDFLSPWAQAANSNPMLGAYKPLWQELMRASIGAFATHPIDTEENRQLARNFSTKGAAAVYERLRLIDPQDAVTETIRAWHLLTDGVWSLNATQIQAAITQADVASTLPGAPLDELATLKRRAADEIARLSKVSTP